MKTIKKAQSGVKQKPKPITGPTFVNLRMARDKSGTGLPATRQDSIDYKKGWQRGLKGDKPSAMEKKYQGENEYEKMGRWEGQNKGKKNAVKKAQNGTAIKQQKLKKDYDSKIKGVKGMSENEKVKKGITKLVPLASQIKANVMPPKPPKKKMGGSMKKCKYGCK